MDSRRVPTSRFTCARTLATAPISVTDAENASRPDQPSRSTTAPTPEKSRTSVRPVMLASRSRGTSAATSRFTCARTLATAPISVTDAENASRPDQPSRSTTAPTPEKSRTSVRPVMLASRSWGTSAATCALTCRHRRLHSSHRFFNPPTQHPFPMYCTVLPCITMYYHVLSCTVLPCITMYYHVLYCTTMYYHVLPCTTMYCHVLYYHVLYCTTMYCTVLPCTVMYCTTMYCTTMYCTTMYCHVLSCTDIGNLIRLMNYSINI